MNSQVVAGVDWAGSGWLAVFFKNGSYDGYAFETTFEDLWGDDEDPALALVDVPIGLPEDTQSLTTREELDSLARAVTERSSSVFPVPSRGACEIAYDDASYEEVVELNERDLDKGLTYQSYYIAAGIGEVDDFLRQNDSANQWLIESHPEVCFRALLERPLEYQKDSSPGVGERLKALETLIDCPGRTLQQITVEIQDGGSEADLDEISIDDVLDAVVLGVTATKGKEGLEYLPEKWECDSRETPIRMAYWGEEPLIH